MTDKPTAAMVLSLIGGVFILLGGAVIALAASLISSLGVPGTGGVGGVVAALGAVGVIFGLIIILGAVMMYSNPQRHTMWGVVILILSILSWVTSAAGFVIGFILGLIGGILALVWKPPMMQPAMGSGMMTATGKPTTSSSIVRCPSCGAMAPAGTMKCPSCGTSL